MILLFIAGLIILLTLGILYFVVPAYYSKVEVADGPWQLSATPAMPPENQEQFSKNQNATLRVFYYIESLPRTNTVLLDASTPVSSFNSQTNTFDICEIGGALSCNHPGFIKLLNVGDSLYIELLQAPDASRPGLPKTQLVIQTMKIEGSNSKTYRETYSLPEFPIQKWVMLTVVRNGNRIDIYYNNKLVFSKNTTYIPNILEGAANFSSSGVNGEAKYLMTSDKVYSPGQVNADYTQMTDTKGAPLEKLFSKINVTLCPSGECFSGPTIRPANPLIQWNSDVM
jgi:hypothetical protein